MTKEPIKGANCKIEFVPLTHSIVISALNYPSDGSITWSDITLNKNNVEPSIFNRLKELASDLK